MEFTNTPPQFLFPLLKTSDILDCMAELGIDITKVELSEPHRHKEKLKKVFTMLLEMCCGVDQERDLHPSQQALDKAATMGYPELHDVSTDVKLFRLLRNCMQTYGIYDFSWKDLHAPNNKRLRYQLSAFINMAKFRNDEMRLFAAMNGPRDEFLVSLEEVNREHDELNAQLHEVQAKAELDFREIERVGEECGALTAQIAHCNKLNQAKREESAALKRNANDLKDELATATWALEEVEAEEERLRAQVVSSPDRRQRELHSKREHLDRERDECRELEEQLQNTKTMCHHVEVATQAMENEVATIESVSSEAQKYSAAAKRLEATAQEVEANQKMVEEEKEQLVLCERDLNRTEEQLSNLHKQSKMKMEAAQEALEQAKSKLSKVEKDRQDGMKQVESGAARVREIETQIEQERLRTQQEIDAMVAEYRETEESFLARIDKRMEKIGAAHNHLI